MDYVTFDASGALTGGYCQELQPDHADCHIEVSGDERLNWMLYRANVARDSVELIPPAVAQAEVLDALVNRLMRNVDDSIAAIYNRWTRFKPEYDAREAVARAFAADRYAGTPSEWITSFAVPAGLTVRDATDRIIAQADALQVALKALGACRMAKYGIAGAIDANAAQLAHDNIMLDVSKIERSLP